ncbi:radial spoke head 10 homolog B-like [Galleria mellonella]|uniref:Radial spoke head 10 homolog B-like n=1 Tax=Galleria mellonella TaxID=7137 RepID=A0A6J1WPA1_GALME|nr:radial spoke head 10 homolog B-like [Galleria mellonella]
MFYVDSQRTLTRRDSSLTVQKKKSQAGEDKFNYETISTARGQSNAHLICESAVSLSIRPKGSVQRELVTMMFESMLDSIVQSWEVISQQKPEDSTPNLEFGKTVSELTFISKKKKPNVKPSKTKKSRSKLEMLDGGQVDPIQQTWWSLPDEKAVIRFRNGNVYEGNISKKCMHGEGRFQWADGTVYLGQFKNNEMNGKGLIQWKDDTWYEGDFVSNLRHGKGLYVDSRKQRSYTGGWHCGTKHGQGVIYYSKTFKNSYDGEWIYNVRHGFGSREYCAMSGYKGDWDKYVRDGKGLMIWPNHDFYKGEWKNGVMSGYGIYIWDACYNNSMSLPSINAYRGSWEKGLRNGYGILNLGLGLGSHYKGEFKNNKKHGVGKFVTNNGMILQDKHLFFDDNIGAMSFDNQEEKTALYEQKRSQQQELFKFDICDSTVGLIYHVEQALKNIDKQQDIRANIIYEYIENNKALEIDIAGTTHKDDIPYQQSDNVINFDDLIEFEELSLRKSLRCYEADLKNIYYKYATICNSEEIHFTPVLIRLFLWQLYFDCNVHEKGLTLVEIDVLFYQNPEWLARSPHNPFEKIYFWQFVHSLISVASKLYAKRQLPGKKPDTILASAFRTFMENDVLFGARVCKGRLTNGYGAYLPLKGLYNLYLKLGEPHTVRNFLCAIRHPSHYLDLSQPALIEAPNKHLPLGRNAYIFGDEMIFITDKQLSYENENTNKDDVELRLFNFGNLSSKTVISIFARIFPQLREKDKIMNLDINITFFEFFEAFVTCTEESIRIKDEEMRWREKLSNDVINI